jgi:excisionase family DNA binding protein
MMITTDGVQVTPLQPIAFKLPDAAAYSGLSRTCLYNRIKTGEIQSFRVGGRRMIFRSAIDAFLARQAQAA